MLTRNTRIGGFLVLVLAAVLSFFHSLDLQTFYKQKCQMTCMEYDVDKLRTDFWDLRFLRFQFCSLGNVPNCSNPYRFKMDKLGEKYTLFRENDENIEEHLEMSFVLGKDTQWKNVHDFNEVIYFPFDWNSPFEQVLSLEHRSARFLYYDLLNFDLEDYKIKYVQLQASEFPKEFKEELRSILILTVIAMNNETDQQNNNETVNVTVQNPYTVSIGTNVNVTVQHTYTVSTRTNVNVTVQNPYTVSIGTNVFDQEKVILTKGSKYYSWFSTVVCMWSFLIILYFVWKILKSLHGCTDEFAVRRAHSPGSHQESHVLTRPDLIPVGTEDLYLFRSYFYSTLFGGQGIYSAKAFIACWFLSIVAYFELLPKLIAIHKNVCILMLIICSIYSLFIIPVVVIFLLCISLIMFTPELLTPELLINRSIKTTLGKGKVWSLFVGGITQVETYSTCDENVVPTEREVFRELLYTDGLCKSVVFNNGLTWFEYSYVVSRDKMSIAKIIFYFLTGYTLSNYELYLIVLLLSCCVMLIVLFSYDKWLRDLLLNRDLVHLLLWLTWPVQILVCWTKSVKRFYSLSDTSLHMIWLALVLALFYLGIFVVPQNVGGTFSSFHMLSYWLFFPIYFIFRTFFIAYTKTISLAVEAVFTTNLIACLFYNFLLRWTYPSLKLLKEKDLFLYAILTLTLVTHLLKIYKEWYDKYDTFLKAVVSYVRNKYKCTENQTELERNEDSISLVYNHTDDSACQDLEENRGHVYDNKYKIKGLLILIKNSNMYIPSDFFFEVIKIPGAPGAIKWVIAKELSTLVLLRLFPAVFIYWLCHVIYLADFENYNLVITAVIGASFVNQYKELFLYRKAPVFDVSGNIAFQRQIDKFLGSYYSWCFVKQP